MPYYTTKPPLVNYPPLCHATLAAASHSSISPRSSRCQPPHRELARPTRVAAGKRVTLTPCPAMARRRCLSGKERDKRAAARQERITIDDGLMIRRLQTPRNPIAPTASSDPLGHHVSKASTVPSGSDTRTAAPTKGTEQSSGGTEEECPRERNVPALAPPRLVISFQAEMKKRWFPGPVVLRVAFNAKRDRYVYYALRNRRD